MPSKPAGSRRRCGHIRRCGSSFQVLAYAGTDPLTGRPHYLNESTTDEKQADRALTRLLAEVDEQRNARTKATLGAALDAWLRVHKIEARPGAGRSRRRRRHHPARLHRLGERVRPPRRPNPRQPPPTPNQAASVVRFAS